MRHIFAALAAFILIISAAAPSYCDGAFFPVNGVKSSPDGHESNITEPTQKAFIIFRNGVEILTLQVSYKGNVSDFAWIVPTPSVPTVSHAAPYLFHRLHKDTSPIIRYWLDSDRTLAGFILTTEVNDLFTKRRASCRNDSGVNLIAEKTIGVYEIAVLEASNSTYLIKWLRGHKYNIPMRMKEVVDDYIKRGWVFTAMRIRTDAAKNISGKQNEGSLQSLTFTFRSSQPVYPLKISALNGSQTKLLIYLLADYKAAQSKLRLIFAKNEEFSYGFSKSARSGADYFMYCMGMHIDWLTKFTADFRPDEMTSDLVFTKAADSECNYEFASPSLLQNIGAMFALIMRIPLSIPFIFLTALLLSGMQKWFNIKKKRSYFAILLWLQLPTFFFSISLISDITSIRANVLFTYYGIFAIILSIAVASIAIIRKRTNSLRQSSHQ